MPGCLIRSCGCPRSGQELRRTGDRVTAFGLGGPARRDASIARWRDLLAAQFPTVMVAKPRLGLAHGAEGRISYYDLGVEVHRSAFKHGVVESSIMHAVEHALVIVDLEAESDPPKVLAIGPDVAGNLLEIIWLELESSSIVIHAMALRRSFYDLLPEEGEPLP